MPIPPELPPEIEIREAGRECIRYVLPLRDLKYGKWLTSALLAAGMVIFCCTLFTIYVIASSFFNLPAPPRRGWGGFTFFVTVAGAPVTWGGLTPLWWGVVSFWGHREIEIKEGYLKTIERCGPFWRSKRWKIEEIASFEIKPLSKLGPSESPPPIDLAAEFNALIIHPQKRKQGMLAWGYPVTLLVAVAHVLQERCNQSIGLKVFGEGDREQRGSIYVYGEGVSRPDSKSSGKTEGKRMKGEAKELDDEDLEDDLEEDELESDPGSPIKAPQGTMIRLDRLEGGDFTITIPPAGVWKGSKGLFFFSLLWCGVLTFISCVFLIALMNNPKEVAKDDATWVAPVVFGTFWLAGAGMFVGALNMGRRRAAIALVGGQLMAIQTGIFGSKKREWALDQIQKVCLGKSGVEVNEVPVMELQITDRQGTTFGFLSERDDEELRWLAYEIEQALPRATDAEAAPEKA